MLKLIALATALSMPGHMPLPPTQAEIAQAAEIAAGIAVASDTAVRTGNSVQVVDTQPPPPPVQETIGFTTDSYNGRCVGAEGLLALYSPGWDVVRMSRIMHRESRCLPWADNPNSSASGLLQILSSLHCRWLNTEVGPCNLFDADYNIRAAAALWLKSGYGAWAL